MKNKKLIIIIISAALAVVIALAVVLALTLGGKDYNSMIKDSREKLTAVTTNFVLTDGEVEVYKYSYGVEITENGAEITTATTKLNPSTFELSTIEDIEFVENPDRANFLNFSFEKDNFNKTEFKKDVLTLDIKGDKLANFLNSESVDSNGENASAVFTFEKGKLTQAVINYITSSGKKVVLTVDCNY